MKFCFPFPCIYTRTAQYCRSILGCYAVCSLFVDFKAILELRQIHVFFCRRSAGVRRTGQPGTRGLWTRGAEEERQMYSEFTEYKVYGVSPDCRQNTLYCRPYGNIFFGGLRWNLYLPPPTKSRNKIQRSTWFPQILHFISSPLTMKQE